MESFPYEPEERGSDYVRLASIAAGDGESRSRPLLLPALTLKLILHVLETPVASSGVSPS